MKSSAGNRSKVRRFASGNNFAPKQKGINTALTFAPLCVKTVKFQNRQSHLKHEKFIRNYQTF